MARIYFVFFMVVVFVAIAGLLMHIQAVNSAYAVVSSSRCYYYALEHDNYIRNTLPPQVMWEDMAGKSAQETAYYDLCNGEEAKGIAYDFAQDPPLEDYHRFVWYNGDVYGYMGGPEPKIGYTQYWICDDGRARVIKSGIELCNTINPI